MESSNSLTSTQSPESIWGLQVAMLTMPQVEVETNHFWINGMYIREMVMPKGMLVVGKIHKQDHFIILTKGLVQVSDERGSRQFAAGDILNAYKGTKRAIFALEDSRWLNVHRTDEQNLEQLELELVELDPATAFLPGNVLKDDYKLIRKD